MIRVGRSLEIRPASNDDWGACRQLLDAAGLPTEDLARKSMAAFLVAESCDDAELVGLIGLEQYGRVGLLRSLVVTAAVRGTGVGSALLKALQNLAVERNVSNLWLLTIDADRYFAGNGFIVTERTQAPAAIAATSEFVDLCPADAVLMHKTL